MCSTFILYILTVLFSLLAIHQSSVFRKKNQFGYCFISLVISFLPLFLLIALRDHVGADYDEYAKSFMRVANGVINIDEIYYKGIGYTYFEIFLSMFIGSNYYIFYAICAFLSILFLFISLIKGSTNPCLSLFIYFCFCLYLGLMNQFRQGLAITLVMLAIYYLLVNNKTRFIIFVLSASFIHPSAIVSLILLFLYNIKLNRIMLLFYFIACLLALFYFPLFAKMLLFTSYGKTYLNWNLYIQSYKLSCLLNLAVRLFFLITMLMIKKEVVTKYPRSILLYHMILINIVIQCASVNFYILARLSTYFFISYVFLFPLAIPFIAKKIKVRYNSLFKIIVYFLFFAYFLIYYYSGSGALGGGYLFYKSILF